MLGVIGMDFAFTGSLVTYTPMSFPGPLVDSEMSSI